MDSQIIWGDCLEVLKDIPDNYFDSLVCDPPASISFMGKTWDHDKGGMLNWINWLADIMSEVLRTMKPGALGLVWSIPRTSHWTGMALELAGFRLIDICHHCFGSGFPKSQDVGKLLDRLFDAEREVLGLSQWYGRNPNGRKLKDEINTKYGVDERTDEQCNIITAPATPEAKQWDGWKTPALKPAVEGWWLVQRPISESSIVKNILKHGVGGLNVEAGRIGTHVDGNRTNGDSKIFKGMGRRGQAWEPVTSGRYPSNLVLSCGVNCQGDNHSPDCPVTVIGEQSGVTSVCGGPKKTNHNKGMFKIGMPGEIYKDTGTAARYFKQLPFDPETITSVYYQAKASTKDRSCNGAVENIHPTVKSRHLMEYLIKLITPPNGLVLDPFGGSGTTAVAAQENGFNYVLIEREKEYIDIITQRVASGKKVNPVVTNPTPPKETNTIKRKTKYAKLELEGQLSLF